MENEKPAGAEAPRRAREAGYRRGRESRERILKVALASFGQKGFQAASTREIAQAAEVNLPAIQYYFGSKEGLYTACAEHIVESYMAATLRVATGAQAALRGGVSQQAGREQLLQVLTSLARFLVSSDEAPGWSLFVQRELAEPGPAFEILFERLWLPGVELVAQLLNGARGLPPTEQAARLDAVHLISGMTAFVSGRAAIDRLLGEPLSEETLADELCRLISRQVEAA